MHFMVILLSMTIFVYFTYLQIYFCVRKIYFKSDNLYFGYNIGDVLLKIL